LSAGTADEYSRIVGFNSPSRSIIVLTEGKAQIAMKNVSPGHPNGFLDIQWRLYLNGGFAV
jgi:hypothetical protein